MSFAVGHTVGQYEIEGQLGQGGMATVYKAYHPALDRHVAIKVMDATLGTEGGFIERFKREGRVIANLDNVHIVPVYDFGEYESQPYFVLKFIDGHTLRDRMKYSALSDSEILEIILAVGDALQYAHMRGVLHRDIKPANVMISRDGKIYLTDFGLAKIIEGSSSLTGERIIGTPHYMSPEQALNTPKLDEGTDIYSFGVMIYELVVGCLPFDGKTAFSIIEDHINTPPPLPTTIKPELARDVEAVIMQALAKNRGDRYDRVASLVTAFRRAWISHTDLQTISPPKKESSQNAVLLSDTGIHFPLISEKVVLGRNSAAKSIQNDVDLTDLDLKKIISRHHAMIKRQNNDFILFDLNSRNGTFLNGKRLAPDTPNTLVSGDTIELGTGGVKLTFTR